MPMENIPFYLSANPNKIKTLTAKLSVSQVFYLSANPNKIKTDNYSIF